jgi:hypothetical protein
MKRVGEENCNGFIFKKKKSVQKVNFRRSSFGHRGKRSLLEIHPSLPSQDYYKHISPLDSDPVRMKQLLLLIGTKSLSTSCPVREVQLQLLERIKSQSLSWYHRKRTLSEQETLVVKKENPVNLSNKKQLQEFNNVISKLSTEISEWKSLLHDYSLKYESKACEQSDSALLVGAEEEEEEEIPLDNYVLDIHQLRNVFYKLEVSTEKISKNTEILFSQILKSYNQKNVAVDTIQMLKLLN